MDNKNLIPSFTQDLINEFDKRFNDGTNYFTVTSIDMIVLDKQETDNTFKRYKFTVSYIENPRTKIEKKIKFYIYTDIHVDDKVMFRMVYNKISDAILFN